MAEGVSHAFCLVFTLYCASIAEIPLLYPGVSHLKFKNLLMPLFLMGCFPVDFQEAKRPLRTKSVKRTIKVGKQPINEGKRPIKAKVLVGVSVGCLMGCFRAPPPWRKTAPLKRPIKRSMTNAHARARGIAPNLCLTFLWFSFFFLGGGGFLFWFRLWKVQDEVWPQGPHLT